MYVPPFAFRVSDLISVLFWATAMALMFGHAFARAGDDFTRAPRWRAFVKTWLFYATCAAPGWVLGSALGRGARADHHPEAAMPWMAAGLIGPLALWAGLALLPQVRRRLFSTARA